MTHLIVIVCRISLSSFPSSILLLTHQSHWKLSDVNWSVWTGMNIWLVNNTVYLLFIVLRILRFWVLNWSESWSVTTWWHLDLLLSDFHFLRVAFVVNCFASRREESLFTIWTILSLIKGILFDLLSVWSSSYCSACCNSCNMGMICGVTIFSLDWFHNGTIEVNN